MRVAIVFVVLSFLGCSSSSSPPPGADGGVSMGGGKPLSQKVSIGPIALMPGEETTVCIVVPLANMVDLAINGVDVALAPGSHHLIVYQSTALPTTTPYPCTPFAGVALGTDVPMFFANKQNLSWTFPDGIAQEAPAQSTVKIEAHYINATQNPIMGRGDVTFRGWEKPDAPPYQPANFTFWGTTKISVPPHSTYSTGQLFQAGIAGTHLISITTHQHRLGTQAQVWESPATGQVGMQIANDLDWANPALTPVQYDFDGTNGLTFQCDWNNTTDQMVAFGESALDEMCFVGGYYWPSQGLDLCINGKCKNRTTH